MKDDKSALQITPFRASNGKFMTQSLFHEENNTDFLARYTLEAYDKEYKGHFLPSLHKLYVEMEDVGEFDFATKYFDGYHHWLKVKAAPWFRPYYEAMVEELNAKMRSKAIRSMRQQVEEGTASQATLKYLADKDYDKAAVGKPKRRKPAKKEGNIVAADFARIQDL